MNVYAKRRAKVLEQMRDNSLLVLYSGVALPRSMDSTLSFEANTHFFYLTGLRRENMALVLRKTSQTTEAIFTEEPVLQAERWTGRRLRTEEVQACSGIETVLWTHELGAYLSRILAREEVDAVYFDCYRNSDELAETYNAAKAKAFSDAYPGIRVRNAHPMIAKLRMVKDAHEIALLRQALAVTDVGLRRVLHQLAPGQREYQAQAEFEYAIRMEGAESVAFPTIAGSGLNGCMLHYVQNDAVLEKDTLLLMDLGARWNGYCADITRTYPVSGRYSERQKQYYDLVLRANREVAQCARPGITLRELNDRCKHVLAQGLIALGKITTPEEIVQYYMHGVSHHLGIDVHDAAVDENAPLAPGMMITDEPGLYIDDEAIGIRIEDDLLITEEGCLVLSQSIPRETGEIEALMGESRAE